jgi:hypothetical protein
MNNPVQPTLVTPTLFDKAFNEIGGVLTTELSWLTNAYRQAEKIPIQRNNRASYEPHIYVGRQDFPNEYLNLLPDEYLENHCFFLVDDGVNIAERKGQLGDFFGTYSLIFWWDYRTTHPTDHLQRTIENVKRDILVLLAKTAFKTCSITIQKTYVEAKNIYKGFDIQDAKQQFLMRPYGGLRIEGQIKIKQNCN